MTLYIIHILFKKSMTKSKIYLLFTFLKSICIIYNAQFTH
jgi:hypothetical protein